MKRFKNEKSDADIVSHGGLTLIGQAVKRHTNLSREVDTQVALRHGIKHSDVLKCYLGLLSIGKNDFEAINTIESEFYYMTGMDINDIPCEATVRQRMDNHVIALKKLMYVAVRIIKASRYLKLYFGKGCRSFSAFEGVYYKLVYR